VKIEKIQPKASLLLQHQSGEFYALKNASSLFASLWLRLTGSSLPALNIPITIKTPQLRMVLNDISSSGSLAVNVTNEQGSFEISLFAVSSDKTLLTIDDRTGIRNLRKQNQVLDDAIKLIDHAHPGALFQVRRGNDNLMSLEFASPRLSEVLGIKNIDVETFLELIGADQKKYLFESFRQCQDELVIRGEISDPKRYWKIMANILEKDENGTVFLGVLENSTTRISQVNQLEYTTNFLRSITNNVPIGISISNIKDRSYLYVNPELARITGYSEEEFLTQGLALTRDKLLIDAEDDLFDRLDHLQSYFLNRRLDEDFSIKGVVDIRSKSGEIRTLNVIFRPLGKPDRPDYATNFIHITEDITEKIRLEQQRRSDEVLLVQSNKMAELGEMASCLAHEINNPLSILTQLLENLQDNHTDAKVFENTFSTLDRITKIVKALTSFARDTGEEGPGDTPIPFSAILSDTLLLCQNKLTNERIDFKISGEVQCCPFINDTLLSQVLLNLINNSYDAICSLNHPKWISINVSVKGNKIVILFSDCGKAQSGEVTKRWFEPFYTSKPRGKGTGLGLPICQNLLRAAGGNIEAIDAKNTTFLITLPIWP
tara:strand:- start:1023 stop:2828 length:1806 start_codon:yes stop_codon:yes gene_type:complete